MATLVSSIVNQLNSKNNGDVVQLTIEKPEGFDDTIANFAVVAKAKAKVVVKMNRLRQAILAVHNYESVMKRFPFLTRDGQGEHSWRTRVLPYVEEASLYDKLDMTKDWDDPANEILESRITQSVFCDSSGKCDVWYIRPAKVPRMPREVLDGNSNTIMMILKPDSSKWYEPKDISVDDAVTYWESLKDGEELIVGFYDGSVQVLDKETSSEEFRSMLEPNDGK
ncbi:MAG: DUF1559 domain-containing protein [Pirellulaceae bacterium]